MIEFDEYITPDGIPYKFQDGQDRFMLSIAGTGMPDIDYITQQGPYQHGETILDYRLKPRQIQLIHRVTSCNRNNYVSSRNTLMNILRPNRQTVAGTITLGTLRKYFHDGSKRDIKVMIQNGPRFNGRNLNQWEENWIDETIIFYAPDPTYYDPTAVTNTWTLTLTQELKFPITFDSTHIVFGSEIINGSLNITYVGTWLTYPSIVITGPINGPEIRNDTTDEFIKLNYEVKSGEVVTIGLQPGNKYVTNNYNENLIGVVTDDSDLATFHIAPAPEATSGLNVISVSGSNSTATTAVVVSFYTRYIGI